MKIEIREFKNILGKKVFTFKFIFTILILLGISYSSIAQKNLTGVIYDSGNHTILPFVNIGIKGKNIGTSSSIDGTFSIKIPLLNVNDTLTLSMVGYSELHIPIQNIAITHQNIFQMNSKAIEIKPVVVLGRKLVEQDFGINFSKSAYQRIKN